MTGTGTMTATKMLAEDHRKVEDLFRRFREASGVKDQADLAAEICGELELHSRLEERIVYPGLARDKADRDLARHLGGEHGDVKRMISEIRLTGQDEADPVPVDAIRMGSLETSVGRHVSEEEQDAFPVMEADGAWNQRMGHELAELRMKLKLCPPVVRSIDLKVPARRAFDTWTQFEAFPRFMKDIKAVKQLDEAHVQWDIEIAGKEIRWTAEIFDQIPDTRIAWSSVDGAVNAGSVHFRPLTAGSCRMLVELCYEPKGVVENVAAMLGTLSRRVASELENFKAYVESGHGPSAGWRGRIQEDPVGPELKRQET